MKIVITMAGKGSRFTNQGYQQPKHEIMAGEHSLFAWALHSLKDFFDETFLFVVRAGSYSPEYLIEEIIRLGIKSYDICVLDHPTEGQAATVMEVAKEINPEDEIMIYNIDTTIKPQYLLKDKVTKRDGCIPLFQAEGTHWSFAKIDNKNSVITEVAEKRPISNWGSVGLYYFKRWQDFQEAYEAEAERIKQEYGEVYIAPLYNYLIQKGKVIKPLFLPKYGYASLGTPEELTEFIQKKLNNFEGDW